jgi:hypothetical protein
MTPDKMLSWNLRWHRPIHSARLNRWKASCDRSMNLQTREALIKHGYELEDSSAYPLCRRCFPAGSTGGQNRVYET